MTIYEEIEAERQNLLKKFGPNDGDTKEDWLLCLLSKLCAAFQEHGKPRYRALLVRLAALTILCIEDSERARPH